MGVEIWIIFVLKIVFVLVAAHIAITKIVPLLNDFLLSFIKDNKSVNSFTSLIDIFILVLAGSQVIALALEVENTALNYISVLQPAFDVLLQIFIYLQWILLVLIAVVAIKSLKR